MGLPIGEAATGKIESATVSTTGRDEAMASATVVGLARSVHPELGGQTWLLAVDGADGSLRPGLAVTAELTMPGPATAGALAPAEAVVRHSGATLLHVSFYFGLVTQVIVEDNGVGFVPDAVPPTSAGLALMRTRLLRAGGRLELQTAPGMGTRLTILMDLRRRSTAVV